MRNSIETNRLCIGEETRIHLVGLWPELLIFVLHLDEVGTRK
mgnify:CR=1 FL=1